MRRRIALTAGTISLVLLAGACGSSTTTTTSTPATGPATSSASVGSSRPATSPTPSTAVPSTAGSTGAAPEVVAPGDIPDNQAFVAASAANGSFSVKVPEGWSRTEANGAVTFTDKYNAVTIESMPAQSAPTVASVKATGLTDVSSDPTFKLLDVTAVTRKPGDGVLATYEIGSAPNAVTSKKALLSVERYVFFHNGTDAVLTLSGAKGSDNVDPWKTVTDSLTWK